MSSKEKFEGNIKQGKIEGIISSEDKFEGNMKQGKCEGIIKRG